jgi:pyruvate-formate lyase
MNERLNELRLRTRERDFVKYHSGRTPDTSAVFDSMNLSWVQRVSRLTALMCEAQDVVIEPGEQIVFTQTVAPVSDVHSAEDWAVISLGRTLHEGVSVISNICPDWGMVLSLGMLGRKKAAQESRRKHSNDAEAAVFLDCVVETIDALLGLVARYAEEAEKIGNDKIAKILKRVPAYPPGSFHEALQSLRFAYAVPWFIGHYQLGFGRFDQYMWPYLENDLESGRLDMEAAEDLLAEFFISLNRDTDLFPGVQPGDNGQTMVINGVKRDGTDGVNELTKMVLRVTDQVALIDPKINLRIDSKTDLSLLQLAAKLTARGLGFPQYVNDDLVIPSLVSHGYELEDARDYAVAGCWEPIIPGFGMEFVNIGAVSFPAASDRAIKETLAEGGSFEEILDKTALDIEEQVFRIADNYKNLLVGPSPYVSMLMNGCIEAGRDLSKGLKYNNFGIFGACSANASDALGAVKKFVFDEKSIEAGELLAALDADFNGYEHVQEKLSKHGPKVGNNDDYVDAIMTSLFRWFAEACEKYGRNGRGGIIRPGVSTAMYYMWLARGSEGMIEPLVGATADGRKRGEPFSANLAPSPGADVKGPLSVLQSFSKIDFQRVFNGGPVTMEFSDSVFRGDESLKKVAMLVRTSAQLGCQQLQINTLNREKLLEAKKNPDKYKDLIVRVWGWSGYFCELDPEYQDHIIARNMYTV